MLNFKDLLIEALKDGLLLTVKYGTIIVFFLLTLNYIMNMRQMAINGNDAATAVMEYQKAGVLPKFPLEKK